MQTAELTDLWTRLCATRDPNLRDRIILQYAPLVIYAMRRPPSMCQASLIKKTSSAPAPSG